MTLEFKNFLLLILVLLICSILGEIVLNVLDVPKFSTPGEVYRRPDEIVNHGFIPNSYGNARSNEFDVEYKINSFGLRNYEFNLTKTKYRILMLGDSFTEGVGVNIDDTIPKKLEKFLIKKGYNVEIINSGVSSYSPILEYLYFKNEGYKFKSDLVILDFDISDIQDDYKYEKIAIKDENLDVVAVPGSKTIPNWKNKIKDWCSLYKINICVGVFYTYSVLKGTDKKRGLNVIPGDIETDRLFPTRFNLTVNQKSNYNRSFDYIKKIMDLAKTNGAEFVLVTYPYGHQVNGKEMTERRIYQKFDEFPVYSLDFFQDVKVFTDKNKINYVDTYYKFNNTKEFPLFNSYDTHMTARGYELVAEAIFDSITSNKEIYDKIPQIKA